MMQFTRVLADQSYQQMPRARLGPHVNGKHLTQRNRVCVLDGTHMCVTDSLTLNRVSFNYCCYNFQICQII